MKLLRIFVYVALRLPRDLYWIAMTFLIQLWYLPIFLYKWGEINMPFSEWYKVDRQYIPFYTTIKTVRQIWNN